MKILKVRGLFWNDSSGIVFGKAFSLVMLLLNTLSMENQLGFGYKRKSTFNSVLIINHVIFEAST